MPPGHNHKTLRKTLSRRQKSKLRQRYSKQLSKVDRQPTATSSITNRFHDILNNLQSPGTRFSSYTITELEPICQQIAIQQMASTTTTTTTTTATVCCPFICIFCQNLIYEPLTLYCGHTFCDQCIKDEQLSSTINCPRCPDDIEGQIQSSIVYARDKLYSKNHFLKQIFERSETFKTKCEMISLCHQGQTEYLNGNYHQAIDIYSKITEKYDDDHLVLCNRAKAYTALQQFDEGLIDATRVIALKPHWIKGHLCHSEILFEMKHFAAALMSSLKALVIDPEDPIAKQIMARHLHAVLHNNDDEEPIIKLNSELEQFNSLPISTDNVMETSISATDSTELTMCPSTQASNASSSCLCLQFDYKKLRLRDFECSICTNLLWFSVTTPCGHTFCRECLIRSVDNTQALCPICKSSLEEFFPMLIYSVVNETAIISKLIETYFPTEYNERRQVYEQEKLRDASIPQSITNNTEPTNFEIPIFICVLALPYCACPLHVYEPRYRLMMRRTIETESRSFGMCAFDEQTRTFSDYGTLLYIRGLIYTQDGRSVVDTIGQRRFRVLERGMRDGYYTAKAQLIQDHAIEQHEFDDLFQLNRNIYERVRNWFDHLDTYRKTLIALQLEEYPPCDDIIQGSIDGPSWSWIMLSLLPIEPLLQYTAVASQSYRIRLQMINDTMDFLLNQQQPTATSTDEQ